MGFKDEDFRASNYMRLNTLTRLQEKGWLNDTLHWIKAA